MGDPELSLEGGRLWRWDTGRTLRVGGAEPGDLVHLAGAADPCPCREALALEVGEGGVCRLPDSALARGRDLRAYLWRGGRTVASLYLAVTDRPRPADYVAEPDRALTWGEIVSRAEEAAKRAEEAADRAEGAGGAGNTITAGEGAPTGAGRAGDLYVDCSTGNLWALEETGKEQG